MRYIKIKQLETISLTVNNQRLSAACQSNTTLLDFLRNNLALKGTHAGCEHGVCGACTVSVDGSAVRSCLGFACQFEGAEITTVEGLSEASGLSDLQLAFSRHHALQCGFCTPGFLVTADDLLRRCPTPTEVARDFLPNFIFSRCTGYAGIVKAIHEVSLMRTKNKREG